jgi:hypothetical protein
MMFGSAQAKKSTYVGLIGLLGLLLALAGPTHAQVDSDFGRHPLEVFLERDIDNAGTSRLLFVDSLTGESTPLEVYGERFTPVGRSVMYFDHRANRMMVALPDGTITPHPFIQPGGLTRRIDWVVSVDDKLLAWTLTDGQDANALTTTTTIANLDGTDSRQVLIDGPRDGIRALPLAFSEDNQTLYMDYQPDAIAAFAPFQQYAGLFALDLETGGLRLLPEEPGCFCGAGVASGMFLRLNLTEDLSGFDVKVHDLHGGFQETIPSLRLSNYTQAGDLMISPDGTRAVYALAQIRDFGGANQSVRTVFVLVNLTTHTQSALTDPITTFVQPLAWTEDNTAILFTSPTLNGTWKVSLSDGRLSKVANATFLGRLPHNSIATLD